MPRHPHRSRRKRPHRAPPGSPPGIIPTIPGEPAPRLELIAYGPDSILETAPFDIARLAEARAAHPVLWINVDGLGHGPTLAALGDALGLHRLSLEDIVGVHQRPKVEDYGTYLFIVLRMPHSADPFETEQVSLCLGRGFVVTFQEHDRPGDAFEPVRRRLREHTGKIRERGPDSLAYALIDAVIDAYFPLLEAFGERLDALEEDVLASADNAISHRIHDIKRDLSGIRRVTWPLRDAMNQLVRDPVPLVTDETRIYLRDCYDHSVQIIDLVESYRELGSGLMDLHLSGMSNRMNQTIKVLTVISTIFIPLTFIAGVYGMNFDPDASPLNMPELRWPMGYPAALLLMAMVASVQLWMFRRWGWIGRRKAKSPPAPPPNSC